MPPHHVLELKVGQFRPRSRDALRLSVDHRDEAEDEGEKACDGDQANPAAERPVPVDVAKHASILV
jgi:hypothetical protein